MANKLTKFSFFQNGQIKERFPIYGFHFCVYMEEQRQLDLYFALSPKEKMHRKAEWQRCSLEDARLTMDSIAAALAQENMPSFPLATNHRRIGLGACFCFRRFIASANETIAAIEINCPPKPFGRTFTATPEECQEIMTNIQNAFVNLPAGHLDFDLIRLADQLLVRED